MEKSGGGAIVFTPFVAEISIAHPVRHIAYGASKAAVVHKAAQIGVERVTRNTRVDAMVFACVDRSIPDGIKNG
ncbi:hypothetical protein [Sulfitobacter sp. F26169L]|uniref:hypothetical protein n=1 Tax=Sulfitobacter sp. F26169L TaxID=2996015 RepID=UPI002260D935|nr:hypothetical protein [Sulfitobacter sp. F26169L]